MSFTVSAWIASTSLPTHDRLLDHSGSEPDTVVVLSAAVGPYAAGTTLDVFLAALYAAALTAANSSNATVKSFTAHAWITGGVFSVNSSLVGTVSASTTASAEIIGGAVASLSADALLIPAVKTLTINAYLTEDVCV